MFAIESFIAKFIYVKTETTLVCKSFTYQAKVLYILCKLAKVTIFSKH